MYSAVCRSGATWVTHRAQAMLPPPSSMPAIFDDFTQFLGLGAAGGVLLATAFHLFVHARIAMLDIFMVSFTMVELWMCAGAVREAETARWRLALAGVAMGCAMASKWSAIPVAMLPGIAFVAVRLRSSGWRAWTSNRGWPVPGIGLPEAFLWLGIVPLAIYAATLEAGQWLSRIGLALVIGGAAGNLIDRVSAGYVLDFFDFYYAGWHFWAFNVADAAITVGVALMILELLGVGRARVSGTV